MKNSIFLHQKIAGASRLFIFSKEEPKMDQLKNSTTVPVVDRFGYMVETQEYRNTPLAELLPKLGRSLLNVQPLVLTELLRPYTGGSRTRNWSFGTALELMAGRKAVGRPEGEHRPRIMATKTSLTNKRILAVAGGEGGRRVDPGDRRMNKLKVCSTAGESKPRR